MAPPRLYQTPSKEQIENSEIKAFIDRVRAKPGLGHIDDFWKLHEWSVQDPEAFWEEIWDWGGILGEKNGKVRRLFLPFSPREIVDSDLMGVGFRQ